MKTVYVPTPVSENPEKEGIYDVKKEGWTGLFSDVWENNEWKYGKFIYWLKPIEVQDELTDGVTEKQFYDYINPNGGQFFKDNNQSNPYGNLLACFNYGLSVARSFYQPKIAAMRDEQCEFAEWCCVEYWVFIRDQNRWARTDDDEVQSFATSAELYQLFLNDKTK